ncbi:hypothetical protein GPROT1_04030 [Gammaproteobacteria bacterium]|nr:hypothetical protein GPROT1_04030 [Gammaproteobacteria bacterium]
MPVLAVTEVRFDPTNTRVIQAKMGPVIRNGKEWVAAPKLVAVEAVIQAIRAGDDVFTIFRQAGSLVPGPKLKVVTAVDGEDTIDIDGTYVPGMTLKGLPTF